MPSTAPVICIDGPAGVGKGTIANKLAQKLGWHLLDSGSLYRIVGLFAHRQNIDFEDIPALTAMTEKLNTQFIQQTQGDEIQLKVVVDDIDVSSDIRTEDCGGYASQIAKHQPVRDALHQLQHSMRRPPGLIADGRDMGSVIFPDAPCKIFLTASAEVRAKRRHKQLKQKEIHANLRALEAEISARDARDKARSASPLIPASDAMLLDTSDLSIDQVMEIVYEHVAKSLD